MGNLLTRLTRYPTMATSVYLACSYNITGMLRLQKKNRIDVGVFVIFFIITLIFIVTLVKTLLL